MVNFDLPFLSVQIVNSRLDIKLKLEEIKLIAITTRERERERGLFLK